MFKKLVSFFIQKLSCWRVNVCIKNWKALETFRLGLFYVYTKPLSCCSSKIFTWLLRCSEQKRQAVYNSNLVVLFSYSAIYGIEYFFLGQVVPTNMLIIFPVYIKLPSWYKNVRYLDTLNKIHIF